MAAARAMAEAKQEMWEELRVAMEKDFQTAPRYFWNTIRHCTRGKWGTFRTVYSRVWTLLTSTILSSIAAEMKDGGGMMSISLGEVINVVKRIHGGKTLVIDDKCQEIVKALGVEKR